MSNEEDICLFSIYFYKPITILNANIYFNLLSYNSIQFTTMFLYKYF